MVISLICAMDKRRVYNLSNEKFSSKRDLARLFKSGPSQPEKDRQNLQ